MGAPIGIGLVAGIAFPAMIIGWYILSGLYNPVCNDSIEIYYDSNYRDCKKENVLL